jgi:hypothetical protein
MRKYELVHADGRTTTEHETEPDAYGAALLIYGDEIAVGEWEPRNGSVERKLIWPNEEIAVNDGGQHAVAEIVRSDD